jgi:hypothetical protein
MKRSKIALMSVAAMVLMSAMAVQGSEIPYTTPSVNGDITTMQGSPGVFTWTDATKAVGDWSAKLYWPGSGGYAQARVFPTVAGVSTVSDVNSWSYWAKAPENYVPNLSFVLDDPDITNDGPIYSGVGYDTVATIWPSNSGNGDNWIKFDSSQSLSFTVWTNAYGSGPIMKSMTWAEFKAPWSQWGNNFDFSNASLLRMNLGKGVIGTNTTVTAYVDDFALNNHTYSFEPVPEPCSLVLLVTAGLGLLAYAGRRR